MESKKGFSLFGIAMEMDRMKWYQTTNDYWYPFSRKIGYYKIKGKFVTSKKLLRLMLSKHIIKAIFSLLFSGHFQFLVFQNNVNVFTFIFSNTFLKTRKNFVKKTQNNKKSFWLFLSQMCSKFSKCGKCYKQKEYIFSNFKTDTQNIKLKMNSKLKTQNWKLKHEKNNP